MRTYYKHYEQDGPRIHSKRDLLRSYWKGWSAMIMAAPRMNASRKRQILSPEYMLADYCTANWAFEVAHDGYPVKR